MSSTIAQIAQAGALALASANAPASVYQGGALVFAEASSPAAISQAGLLVWGSYELPTIGGDVSQAGAVVHTINDPAGAVAQSGVLAWCEYKQPYAVSQAGAIAFVKSDAPAQSFQAGILVWASYQQSIAAPVAPPVIVKANGDIALVWDNVNGFADFAMSGPDLLTDAGLETAIIISLFTDRLADPDDVLPDGGTDRRGWWGDAYSTASAVNGYPDLIGSRLWLLERSILNAATLNQAKDYCEEALAWMLQDGVVGDLAVTCTAVTINTMVIQVDYTQAGSKKTFSKKWSTLA